MFSALILTIKLERGGRRRERERESVRERERGGKRERA